MVSVRKSRPTNQRNSSLTPTQIAWSTYKSNQARMLMVLCVNIPTVCPVSKVTGCLMHAMGTEEISALENPSVYSMPNIRDVVNRHVSGFFYGSQHAPECAKEEVVVRHLVEWIPCAWYMTVCGPPLEWSVVHVDREFEASRLWNGVWYALIEFEASCTASAQRAPWKCILGFLGFLGFLGLFRGTTPVLKNNEADTYSSLFVSPLIVHGSGSFGDFAGL